MTARAHGRLMVIGLFAVFFVPILVAWWLNLHTDQWRPSVTTNHGTLVVPARPLSALGLRHLAGAPFDEGFLQGAWTLVFIGSVPCGADCARQLYKVRQARLALGKDMSRVRCLFAVVGTTKAEAVSKWDGSEPGLFLARATPQWLEPFQLDREEPGKADRIYLVDPEGQLMMEYDVTTAASGILKDLQRLLKISKIG